MLTLALQVPGRVIVMMETRGVLVGAGAQPCEDRKSGQIVDRPKISLSGGVVTQLPKMYPAEESAMRDAQGLPFGIEVILSLETDRYNQVVVKSVRKAG